jgi:hypothetical protein
MTPNKSRGCVKTPRRPDAPKKRRSHFRYGAFLFSVKVIRTTFSFFKMTESEFSHSLSLQATRDGRSSSAIADYIISPACLSSGR